MRAIKWRPAAIAVLAASTLAVAPMMAAASTTLKYSDHDPTNGMRTDFVDKVWLKTIKEKAGDDVDIQTFWGGSLLGSKEILKGIGDGITEMGFVYPGHYPGQLPAHTIFRLFPRGPKKFADMLWFYREVYKKVPAFQAELKKAHVKTLLFTAGLPGAFVGKKPLHSLADIKGQKWRAGDKWSLRFLQNAGAQPTSIPWGDTYMALQTGAIDGCYTNYDGAHLMKFDETAPNVLVSKSLWYGIPFLHLINENTFNRLSTKTQQENLDASDIAEKKFAKVYDDAFTQIVKDERAAGVKVTFMTDDDLIKWEDSDELEGLQQQWVKEAQQAGLKNAEQVMKQVKDIYAQAMKREDSKEG